MADTAALERALINADAAGDVEAARVLAGEITRLRGTPEAPKPDKYQQAAIEERDALKAKGIDTGAGYTRRLAQGATLNFADEVLAGLSTPLEMVKRGTFDPREGYNYAKAREDLILDDARQNTGVLGTAVEIGGGVGAGAGALRAGLTFARNLPQNAGILSRSLASAGDSAAFGALAGAGEGSGIKERFNNALLGGLVGGGIGLVAPGLTSLIGQVASPVISNLRARFNPQGFAQSQVARAVEESGLTPNQLSLDMVQAANEGQGAYTLADALGNAGQRMLATTTRSPGRARTDVLEFLDQRQAGQGRRIASALSEGFDAPQTAAQTEARLTAQRAADADAAYGAARQQAGSVNVTPAIQEIDRTLQPGVSRLFNPQSNIADDSIEATLRRARGLLTDGRSQVSRFEEAFRVKTELDNMIDNARPTMQRVLIPVRNALDRQLEQASAPYAAARNQFRQQSQAIESVGTGRDASMRGRTEDVIPAYATMRPDQQAAYRAGYVDPLIAQTQGSAFGANKARPLINDAFADEAAVMAPGNAMMQRRIGRENTMFQTRHASVGNSKTAENLNDDAAMGVSPTLVGQLLSGNWSGALRTSLAAGQNALTGNTAQVRQAVADILLQRGSNMSPAALQRMVDETTRRIQQIQMITRSMGRAAAGGLSVTPAATEARR
ncbi:hypothetical protein JQ628_11300 [Bradyrhizobium lablabi]|uniref:hypothetical protein n=1 Tax=Bradyrhizobium lablabi TaxID=722472 RepID=UPI001BADF9ED|nr:hypothetical protein [Bradyrhizobium lablabi]MBR1122102.1 hypothetical protein [Bradyrhizobium lablabi]